MNRERSERALDGPRWRRWTFWLVALVHWATAVGYLAGGRQAFIDRTPWLLLTLVEGAYLALVWAAPSRPGLVLLVAIELTVQMGLTWVVPPDADRGLWWCASWTALVAMLGLWVLAWLDRGGWPRREAILLVGLASFLFVEWRLSQVSPLPIFPADAPDGGLTLERRDDGTSGYVRGSDQPVARAWKAEPALEPLPAAGSLSANRLMIRSSAGLVASSLALRSGERSLRLRSAADDAAARAEQAVIVPLLSVRARLKYRVEGWARADQPTTLTMFLAAPNREYRNLGLYAQIPLDAAWSRFESRFQATDDDLGALLELRVPPDGAEWELKDLVFAPDPGEPSNGTGGPPPTTAWGIRYQFNSQGFRDLEREPSCPPGTLRVAVLGDSLVVGEGLPGEHTLTSRLARASRPIGLPCRWLNLGCRGTLSGDWQQLFEEFAAPAGARLAIVVVRIDDPWVAWQMRAEADDPRRRPLSHSAAALRRWLGAEESLQPVRWFEEVWRLHAAIRQRRARMLLVLFPADQSPRTNQFLDLVSRELGRTGLAWLDLRPVLGTARGAPDTSRDEAPNALGPAAQELAAVAIAEHLEQQAWWRTWNHPAAENVDPARSGAFLLPQAAGVGLATSLSATTVPTASRERPRPSEDGK